jgi:capsular exopolysaccharide synthesis family protein
MNIGPKTPSMPYQQPQMDDNTENILDKLGIYLRFWPLFLISIAICLGLGYLFIRSAVPVYTVYAKILINDENTGQNVKQENQSFSNLKKVDDEIQILTSRTIMEAVVDDLQLWTQYYQMGNLNTVDLYKNTPVKFTLIKAVQPLGGQWLDITIQDKKTFLLNQTHSVSTFHFGEQLKSDWGSWKVEPTARLEDFVGQRIRIYLNDPQQVTDNYLAAFDAAMQAEQSSVVQLSIKETVPDRGADVINRTIKAYNLASIDYKNKVNHSTLNFLNDRLDSITSELNYVEKKVETYKSTRGITDLSAESQYYLDNVKNNDSKLNEVNVQLEIINEIQKYINSPVSDGNAPATAGITDPGLVSLVGQLIQLESQRDRLLSNTPEKNPVFVPLNRQISTTKNAIRENIKGIKRSFIATRNQFRKYNRSFESSIKKLPGQEREYITIKRQQSIKEELYIFLLQKREEAGVTNASKLLDSRIIDQAHFGAPELRNANFTYALCLIFGLVFPAGIIFAKDALNNKVTTIKEIENRAVVPVLGELSYQKSLTPISILEGSRTMMSEQFRTLRTKLSLLNGKSGNGKVTLLTSGMPGEGKSMISRNLGAVMAAAGRKTVIIDADFRKPQLAEALNLPNDIGLSNYLNGSAFKEQIVQTSMVHAQLFVISTGSDVVNPSELLEKPALAELFEWLRMYFDEIIIDTPPVQLVTDALILSAFSDTNLYVVRQNYTYKSQFKYINQLRQDAHLKNLHIVFNGVSTNAGYNYTNKYANQYYTPERPRFRLSLLRKN